MALHVRGVVLPDDEVRDLWLVGDRVTTTPVPDAQTVSDGGFILPGLVDAHCHLGIAPGSTPITSLDEARALASMDRAAGVLAIRDAGSPYPYPELDDDHDVPRLARAGQHVAPVRRYLRDVGVEVTAPDVAGAITAQAKAGNGWVKLVGDWIDREVGDLAPAWDPDTLTAAFQLVGTLTGLGEYHAARELNDDIIARRRRVLGDEHPETIMAGAFDFILRGLDLGGEPEWMAALREASKRRQQEAREPDS